jgi:hypothetical protein
MTKQTRRKLHAAINRLSNQKVAAIVRQNFPGARGAKVDELAKLVIAGAHRMVSPRPR